jgi:hypothetical protein
VVSKEGLLYSRITKQGHKFDHLSKPQVARKLCTSLVFTCPLSAVRLKSAWLNPHQVESLLGDNHPQGESTAGQALAIQAVAGID